MQHIESESFSARVNIASSPRVFLESMSSDSAFSALLGELRLHRTNVNRVVSRLRELVGSQVDYRYENPHDVALAAYTFALSIIDVDVGRIAAELVASAAQTWWARHVASMLLQAPRNEIVTSKVPFDPFRTEAVAGYDIARALSVDVTQVTLPSRLLLNLSDFVVCVDAEVDLPPVAWELNRVGWTVEARPNVIFIAESSVHADVRSLAWAA